MALTDFMPVGRRLDTHRIGLRGQRHKSAAKVEDQCARAITEVRLQPLQTRYRCGPACVRQAEWHSQCLQ